MKRLILSFILLYTVVLEAKVTINSASYQQVVKNGKKRWVKATKVVPGTIILYINTISNSGNSSASNLIIDNKIPKEMKYIRHSAKSKLRANITYSVDNGKSYHKPNRLYVRKHGKRVRAKAYDYTNIRWVIKRLKAKTKTVVQYRAKLK